MISLLASSQIQVYSCDALRLYQYTMPRFAHVDSLEVTPTLFANIEPVHIVIAGIVGDFGVIASVAEGAAETLVEPLAIAP